MINKIIRECYEWRFIDTSTAYAENMIKLYHYVWFFLIFILVLVIVVMYRLYALHIYKRVPYPIYIKILLSIDNIFKLTYGSVDLFVDMGIIKEEQYFNVLFEKAFNKNYINIFYYERWEEVVYNGVEALVFSKKIMDSLMKITTLSEKDTINYIVSNFSKRLGNQYLSVCDITEYKYLEYAWCVFPTVILGLIVWPSFNLLYSLDPALDPFINIKVVGHQWYWTYQIRFNYFLVGDGVNNDTKLEDITDEWVYRNKKQAKQVFDSTIVQEEDLEFGTHRLYEVDRRLNLPIGVPIRFVITSADVLHSWSLPSIGVKVDAVPGRLNQYVTIIKRPGVFYGQCSELCGPGHGFMPIAVKAVPYNEFMKYLFNNYELLGDPTVFSKK